MHNQVGVGYQTFVDDDAEEFGAVRAIAHDYVVVYVENAGEFTIPTTAITSVQSQKVTFSCARLDKRLRAAIGHAHDAEA